MTTNNITAWTLVGALSPPFVSINDVSGHVIEIHVRAPAKADGVSGDTVTVTMSRSQFDGLIRRAVDWLNGNSDDDVLPSQEPIDAAPDLVAALKLFTSASISESRPTRGESLIGWQKGDGLSASERVAIARAAIARAEGR